METTIIGFIKYHVSMQVLPDYTFINTHNISKVGWFPEYKLAFYDRSSRRYPKTLRERHNCCDAPILPADCWQSHSISWQPGRIASRERLEFSVEVDRSEQWSPTRGAIT